MPDFDYDLLVIGSGPAGQRAAIQAAKLGKHVAIVERKAVVGGVCINTGTIPSKTLRETVLHLSGYRERGLYGASYTVKQNITMSDLLMRTDRVISHEIDVTRHQLPRTLSVVGAGVIGLEYASMFAALGVRVTLIDKRPRLLAFVDAEIIETLAYQLRQNLVTLRLGEEVSGIEPIDDEHGARVNIHLASGKQIIAEKALYSIGRTGAIQELNLPAAGLEADARGRLGVNAVYQTEAPHIYAVGDLIGFPSLASTSMEQGRLAACHAFGVPANSVPALFPYGIYTIPEISTVGRNEEELTEQGIAYEVGKAQYREIARGQILGDSTGLLKLIFHAETRALLGVHIIGEGASELIHIGQAVLAFGGPIDYFVNTVFNYPTLAECYKTAAFDGINRLG